MSLQGFLVLRAPRQFLGNLWRFVFNKNLRDFIELFVSFVLRKVEGLEGFKVLGMKCFRDFLRDLSSHSCHSCNYSLYYIYSAVLITPSGVVFKKFSGN